MNTMDYLKNHNANFTDFDLHYIEESLNSTNKVSIAEVMNEFIDIDKYFGGENWNLKQILVNLSLFDVHEE